MQTTVEPSIPLATSVRAAAAGVVWTLAHGGLPSEHLTAGQHRHLTCLIGECWITMESHAEDHVLREGDETLLHGPVLVVIEAIHGPSHFQCGKIEGC